MIVLPDKIWITLSMFSTLAFELFVPSPYDMIAATVVQLMLLFEFRAEARNVLSKIKAGRTNWRLHGFFIFPFIIGRLVYIKCEVRLFPWYPIQDITVIVICYVCYALLSLFLYGIEVKPYNTRE